MSDTDRRLPVYLVIDCSGSMSGDPIESVRAGIRSLVSDLKNDPQAVETAHLSVITFASTAQQIAPLVDLMNFQEPHLDAVGTTSLGEALTILESCIQTEIRPSAPNQRGDWSPLIFLMTDGQPTDDWEAPAQRLKEQQAQIIACAAGTGANAAMLKRITATVVELHTLQPDALKAFFAWVSTAIKTTAHTPQQAPARAAPLPPPPPQITIIP
jgi:uncharacterized protein YegL